MFESLSKDVDIEHGKLYARPQDIISRFGIVAVFILKYHWNENNSGSHVQIISKFRRMVD